MGGGGNGGLKSCKSCVALNASATTSTTSSSTSSCKEHSYDYYGELEASSLFLSSSPTGVADEGEQPLYLPRRETAPCSLDVYLQSIPSVASRAEQLFSVDHKSDTDDDATNDDTTTTTTTTTSTKPWHSQKCLTVLQGEVAHASAEQTDVLVSAEATTCHIVALRSTTASNSTTPLASMAHIDQADVYDTCLDKMIQEHLAHHNNNGKSTTVEGAGGDDYGFYDALEDDEDGDHDEDDDNSFHGSDCLSCCLRLEGEDYEAPGNHHHHHRQQSFLPEAVPSSPSEWLRSQSLPSLQTKTATTTPAEPVEMELHIAGGYLDKDGTSQQLSTSLIHSFNTLATKYQGQLRISLSTAAISALNTTTTTTTTTTSTTTSDGLPTTTDSTSNAGPRSRGLALNLHTGQVTAVTTALPQALEGPAMEIRSARHLEDTTTSGTTKALAVIHTPKSNDIIVHPFPYQAQPQWDVLLQVPDPVLLQVTSTSPEHESERFCSDLRRTLSFVNAVPSSQIFSGNKPLKYSRSTTALNEWVAVL